MEKIKVLAVVGPTASGKTSLGVRLAEQFDGEVVSADSMQIYKGMDIATAKPTLEEMRGIEHHLIDYVEPEESYSVARYVADAERVVADITARGKLAVIVGGTGLYIDSLLGGIRFSEQPENTEIRAALNAEAEQMGNIHMYERLTAIDPDYAAGLHPNNTGRVIRAIELFELTGRTMTEQLALSRMEPSKYDAVMLGLDFENRDRLYGRINQRVDMMMRDGLLEEAASFYMGHSAKTAAQAIGCKEFLGYFSGEKTAGECVEQIKLQTRRYAKRQLTWFRRNKDIHWLYRDRFESLKRSVARLKR